MTDARGIATTELTQRLSADRMKCVVPAIHERAPRDMGFQPMLDDLRSQTCFQPERSDLFCSSSFGFARSKEPRQRRAKASIESANHSARAGYPCHGRLVRRSLFGTRSVNPALSQSGIRRSLGSASRRRSGATQFPSDRRLIVIRGCPSTAAPLPAAAWSPADASHPAPWPVPLWPRPWRRDTPAL